MRCQHCERFDFEHNSKGRACPIGRKHRTLGFTSYHRSNVFTPKPPRARAGKAGAVGINGLTEAETSATASVAGIVAAAAAPPVAPAP